MRNRPTSRSQQAYHRGTVKIYLLALALLVASTAAAQDVTIFDDALQNGFLNYSYGGGSDFTSTAQAHDGTKSIAMTGTGYNAAAFAQPTINYTTAAYPPVHFWVHGGTTGGQQLAIQLYLDNAVVASGELDTFITGGALVANQWREVTVTFAQAPLSYNGSFDRIDLQSDSAGAQPTFYIDQVILQAPAAQASSTMQIEEGVTVGGMLSDRFTWKDSNNESRVAVLAHNTGQTGPGGTRGGELREFRYQVGGNTRVVAASSSGASGFGYVVSHPDDSETCMAGGGYDSSSLGHFWTGSITRVFEGRHHAIFRFTQNYPRYCKTGGAPGAPIYIPVTIDWVFATGRDHPLWSVTWDMNAIAADTLLDDSRAPYGELLFDGAASEGAHSTIAGVGWGDRYKFTSTTSPVTYGSSWTWNTANTIPYVKLWTTAVDATMGTVQTQPITQQDAGGYFGTDRWNTTSAAGDACPGQGAVMPCDYNWPYQSINYSIYGGATNNTRLAWGTNFGFLGQSAYYVHGSAYYGGPLPNATAAGWPRKSYSAFIVFGKHTTAPVEAQVTQIETIQNLTLSATTGSVVASGPAGVGDSTNVTYTPTGYDRVYSALTFSAAGNALDANIALSAGTLAKPLIIVKNFTSASYPTVKFANATLVADADYFASLRASANELWITLNRNVSGVTNHFEIIASAVPAAPTNLAAVAITTTRIDLSWTAVAGASSYQVDRKAPGGGYVQINAPAGNSFSDTTVTGGNAYIYRVRAVNGSGPSSNSTPDLATTIFFTDPALTGLVVKATHLSEIRTAIEAVATLAGLGASAYTDAATAGVVIKAVHLTEARTRLDAARSALGLSTGGYTDAAPTGLAVKAVHWQELRDGVK